MKGLELLEFVSRFGTMMLSCGGEINRVEDSIKRICVAYGYDDISVFAIPRTLIITVSENGVPITKLQNIQNRGVNLDRVARLNSLSRMICAVKPSADTVNRRLDHIGKSPLYGRTLIYASNFAAPFCYALVFGGGWREAAAAGIAGLAVRFIEDFASRSDAGVLFENLLSACVMVIVAMLFYISGFALAYDKTIIGVLMMLVPGVTLTNGARDFISGDFFAGTYTLIEALLSAVGIAAGVAVTMGLFRGF